MATAAARQDWRDAYDTQLELLRWVRSDTGRAWMQHDAARVVREYGKRTQFLIRSMYDMEEARLESASPYFVSADMCSLVEAAAPSFAPEPIFPTDVLTLSGFVYFAKPLVIPDRFDRPTRYRAFSWHPCMTGDFDPGRVLTRDDEFREYLEERHQRGHQDGLSLCLYQAEPDEWPEGLLRPPVLAAHVTPWWWGMSFEGNEVTEAGRPTGASHWWAVVQTTLRLMQQKISVHHQERPDRAARRFAKRLDLIDRGVTVVTLRRERTPEHGEPVEEHHYSHRFIVGGHWRNQWYPSAGVHRQIWIAPYEKGPQDAPLIIKPRVYRWTR
ncbi:MAG TPA: hypothetical protein VH541_05760 [Gaiellaceae bacterium]|jgi:hypothetical protein